VRAVEVGAGAVEIAEEGGELAAVHIVGLGEAE
jgi:hypothetical protein